ncbi:MAG: GSCFA domain-containing protein [Prevotella sp.]|nr:GSCFA domain-containing protein [Prevotella sp.]
MKFSTTVNIPAPSFSIQPMEEMLFVGSCFADGIGRRFEEEKFKVTVNPFGTMYNPASVLHTLQRLDTIPRIVFLTLGTNHVYILKETGEIVDNCQKRPARLFEERELSVDECADYLLQCVATLQAKRPDVQVVFTVSPIRYAKYGFHGSQLSKATLLLAIDKILQQDINTSKTTPETIVQTPKLPSSQTNTSKTTPETIVQTPKLPNSQTPLSYFPAYEIVLDELRDYRFYSPDMLHPSSQTVEYIFERLTEFYLSPEARHFIEEWHPIKEALAHRPIHPESDEYQQFLAKTKEKIQQLTLKYPGLSVASP